MRALGRFERNRREAIRTVPGGRRSCRCRFLHPINLFDEQKNRERDDDKIQNIVKKDAVIQGRGAGSLCRDDTWIIFAG